MKITNLHILMGECGIAHARVRSVEQATCIAADMLQPVDGICLAFTSFLATAPARIHRNHQLSH